ncbi:MAG: alpha/beta fold hydrolase [Promethearchaeota archaeon]
MSKINYLEGVSSNNIPYLRFGNGSKHMLVFYGGPGNILPRGMLTSSFTKGFCPFVHDYTITFLSRKIGLTDDYTTERMAQDYAEMIKTDYNNHVDVIIGYSYGGIIAQHFAAMFPELFDHLIIMGATNKVTSEGMKLDREFAELLSRGKKAKAFSLMGIIFSKSKIKRFLMKSTLFLVSFFIKLPDYESFSSDILIEFKAEEEHDASEQFSKITKPILILIGENDYYFTTESAENMAKEMPNSILKIYKNTGHELDSNPDFEQDIREYIGNY